MRGPPDAGSVTSLLAVPTAVPLTAKFIRWVRPSET